MLHSIMEKKEEKDIREGGLSRHKKATDRRPSRRPLFSSRPNPMGRFHTMEEAMLLNWDILATERESPSSQPQTTTPTRQVWATAELTASRLATSLSRSTTQQKQWSLE
jgi:hypothetical protein